jgi:hypothetical protein
MQPKPSRPIAGVSAIALAIAFNVPFSILAATFDYPDILRRPAGEALAAFAAGGAPLVLTWYAFMLTALAMAPVSIAIAVSPTRIASNPVLAAGGAIAGALAALAQAIGLSRWVFVVPGLARMHESGSAEAQSAAARSFDLLNQYGGVAIGENIGQFLTALFVVFVSSAQLREKKIVSGALGLLAAAMIAAGTGEGVALAIGRSGELFANITIAGFAGLTLWLVTTGIGLIRGR